MQNSTLAGVTADLEVKSRTVEGAYLDLQILSYGDITWLRISTYPKATLKSGQEYTMFKISANSPRFSIHKRIYISNTLGFTFHMSVEGEISITPFGGDVSTSTGVNLSECYIMK